MCGAYIGVDEYRSKLAVLRERFESSSAASVAAKPNLGADSTLAAAAEEAPVKESGAGRNVWSDAL
jgi:trimethyllysine dioxygenase